MTDISEDGIWILWQEVPGDWGGIRDRPWASQAAHRPGGGGVGSLKDQAEPPVTCCKIPNHQPTVYVENMFIEWIQNILIDKVEVFVNVQC